MPQNVFTANTLFIQRKCGSLLACHVLLCICEIHYTTHMTEQHKKMLENTNKQQQQQQSRPQRHLFKDVAQFVFLFVCLHCNERPQLFT